MMRTAVVATSFAGALGFGSMPHDADSKVFNRVSAFLVCTALDGTCNTDSETVAEIITATDDGMTVLYTDGAQVRLASSPRS